MAKKIKHVAGLFECLTEKRAFGHILAKENQTLTPAESKLALQVILKWMKGDQLAPLPTEFYPATPLKRLSQRDRPPACA